jgi:hypothetical protein
MRMSCRQDSKQSQSPIGAGRRTGWARSNRPRPRRAAARTRLGTDEDIGPSLRSHLTDALSLTRLHGAFRRPCARGLPSSHLLTLLRLCSSAMSSSLALAADERVRLVIQSLPALSADALPSLDDACPICLLPFKVILSGERNQSCSVELEPLDGGVVMVCNSAMPDEYAGVTKSPGCGHLFCKRE